MSDAPERTPLETVAFAAWVNCDPKDIPPQYKGHTCEATMTAWKRVVEAVSAELEAQKGVLLLLCEDRFNEIAGLRLQLADARDQALEDAAARLHLLWNADGTKGERRVVTDCIKAIRAMKGAKP